MGGGTTAVFKPGESEQLIERRATSCGPQDESVVGGQLNASR
jgi:hypothetical protein